MKSIILNTKTKFPCLKQIKQNEEDESFFIVLFVKDKVGMVVYKDENCEWDLGYYADDWSMECFESFNGEIKLSN